MSYSIYIADDEDNIRELIRNFLQSDGYEVEDFPNGDLLFERFMKKPCDLVVLDIMMPGTDGLSICRKLREITSIPIIMLTAKDSELDYINGINTGSDDYITKPFRPTMLLMKIRALLRRVEMDGARQGDDNIQYSFGDLTYDTDKNAVLRNGEEVRFTQTELRMFSFMMKNPEKVYSRDSLLAEVWGFDDEVETRVTDETLRRIRKKLSLAGSNVSVVTVWGYGFRLEVSGK
jgi:two-component system, OmpR family, response regulator ResD